MRRSISWLSAVVVVLAMTSSASAANSVQCDNGFPKLAVDPNNANLTIIQAKGTVTTDAGWTCTQVNASVTVMRNGQPVNVGFENTIMAPINAWGQWTFGGYQNDTYTLTITATFQKGTVVDTKTISYTVTITGVGLGTVVVNNTNPG